MFVWANEWVWVCVCKFIKWLICSCLLITGSIRFILSFGFIISTSSSSTLYQLYLNIVVFFFCSFPLPMNTFNRFVCSFFLRLHISQFFRCQLHANKITITLKTCASFIFSFNSFYFIFGLYAIFIYIYLFIYIYIYYWKTICPSNCSNFP